ncbi:hypothetical protein [Gaetbulibacter sp. NE]|uniref:hypothetical protein n=1 Tax=Gaetbulibacter sp. NE TaxID=2982307 RepID=UPI0021D00448|nr:hypothetical protein [Gaetbulibacter sp. NE]
MRLFVVNVLVFIACILIGVFIVFSKADGYTDAFYKRFTTPKQSNLIIGISHAAQGIQPKVLKSELDRNFFNYAFSSAHSPYGPTYLKSIKRKLDKTHKNGIFILTVDPYSISSWTKDPNDSSSFRELNLCLANTPYVNIEPNFFYLLRNYNDKHLNLILKKDSIQFLHDDGWLEISINMDSVNVNKRIASKIKTYKEDYLPKTNFSNTRLNYLENTVSFLKQHGQVFIVRLPVHPLMREIENTYMPDFEEKIQKIITQSDGYLNFENEDADYIYTDGNHLYKTSGEIVTQKIAEWIKKVEQ